MTMDAQALPPPQQVGRWGFLIATILLGFAGSLIGLVVLGQGEYIMGPFVVDLSVKPAASGTTDLGISPNITGIKPGYAEANTHAGFLSISATVIDIARPPRLDLAAPRAANPRLLAESLKDEGKAAGQAFARRAALGVVAGGAAGGAIMALFGWRPRRIFEGLLAGTLLVGLLAIIAWQTYDVNKFSGTQFRPTPASALRVPAG